MISMKLFLSIICTFLTVWAMPMESNAQEKSIPQSSMSLSASYSMGAGDRLRIITYGEPDLGGEFEINSDGNISFPLIGEIKAVGLNILTLKDKLIAELKDGYLVAPKVSIELLSLRPFYIMGEVKRPGSYEYISGMTVVNAIALAGGYTHRANEKKIEVRRQVGEEVTKMNLDENSDVLPGDTLRVNERFF